MTTEKESPIFHWLHLTGSYGVFYPQFCNITKYITFLIKKTVIETSCMGPYIIAIRKSVPGLMYQRKTVGAAKLNFKEARITTYI